MKIKLIVAVSEDNCIGFENDLVFKSKKDLRRFKELTTNHIVVMGSKTYESIGSKPLPNRINIVLSNKLVDNNIYVYNDVNKILDDMLKYYPEKDIWIIGGENVYYQFKDIVDELHVTKANVITDKCDTWFDISKFRNIVLDSTEYIEEGEKSHEYLIYKKK
jgi:dihydrofolate reductase